MRMACLSSFSRGITVDRTEVLQQAQAYFEQGRDLALEWLLSPAAWTQFGLLVVAYGAAVLVSRRLRPLLEKLLTPPEGAQKVIARARRFVFLFIPLLLPLLAYGLTGIGESVTRAAFGSGEVIAFGKRVFMFLAARILVKEIIEDPLMKVLGKYLLVPVAALYAVGILDEVMAKMDETVVPLGNLSFSLLFLVRFAVVAGAIFWLASPPQDPPKSCPATPQA